MSISKMAQQHLHLHRRLKRVSLHPSSPPSTGEPLRACWPDASMSGMGTVVQQTARPSSGQWTPSVPLSPSSWIFFFLTRCSSKANSFVKDSTHPSSLFQLLPSGRRYQSIRARSARLLNSFFPRLWEPWTQNHPAPLWNPIQTPTSWNMDSPPPHPPSLPRHRKKTVKLFCAIQSVLHTGETH